MTTILVVVVISTALGSMAFAWIRAKGMRCSEVEENLKIVNERVEQLELMNRLLEASLNAVPQGLIVCDDEGSDILRNAAAQVFVEARHGDALVEQAIHEVINSALIGEPAHQDLNLIGPPQRMISVSALPLSERNHRFGSVVIVDDVSERRRIDDVRRDFVANISHELKTPIGALGLLAETISTEDDLEVVQRLSRRMTDEAFRVARMIDDLLDLSRIEADEGDKAEPVSLYQVITAATERVKSIARDRSIAIDLQGVGQDLVVFVDESQLISAVGNLLENACKYSDEHSTVKVETSCNGSWIEIAVIDSGIGIPTRDIERVFERFYRVDRARSRETGGTGLGLSIVRHVLSNHGGEVHVQSIEGEGSAFTLRLPLGLGKVDEI